MARKTAPKKPTSDADKPAYRKRASGDGYLIHGYLARTGEEALLYELLLRAKDTFGTPTSMILKQALKSHLPYLLSGEYHKRISAGFDKASVADFDPEEQKIINATEVALRNVVTQALAKTETKPKKG